MSEFKVLMPKMGESVQEATITKWFVNEGDKIAEDDILFEIATEKVDSEIPSPVDGVLSKIYYPVDSVVPVGEVVALIQTGEAALPDRSGSASSDEETSPSEPKQKAVDLHKEKSKQVSSRFYSPLVRSMARAENISPDELETIPGSGMNGRVQKQDLLDYLSTRGVRTPVATPSPAPSVPHTPAPKAPMSLGAQDQIVEMDRVRKLIAAHMVHSAQVAPHVTSVVEADVTNLVL